MNPRPYIKGETIAAVATPPGEGGVAIIRISGNDALQVAAKIYTGPLHSYTSHTLHCGKIVDCAGTLIDEVLIVVMRAPRSYTGEETVEIHCHGGSLITRRVLHTVLEAGARAALPGEFTFKAYMNGKLDLAQAEAVQTLIGAKNNLALKAAEHQLEGAMSRAVKQLQEELIGIIAILEAWVDFPEEGLEFAPLQAIILQLRHVHINISTLAATFEEGKLLQEGISLCLCGAPNVGKSSLMNALLGKDRAIVTPTPGTTRDLLEADLRFGNLHFHLIDTAGIRSTEDAIEQEGIRRSHDALQRADVALVVLDATRGIEAEDQHILSHAPMGKTVLIWNKTDLPSNHPMPQGAIPLSAKEGKGVDALKEAIQALIYNPALSKEEVIITTLRHHEALLQAAHLIAQAITGLEQSQSPEFLASDLKAALKALGTIIGLDVTEEILSAIFSTFCVGK